MAEVVGEAFLSAFCEVLIGKMASREVLDYFRSRKLDDARLKKLKTTLLSIKAVLNDADDKQSIKPDVRDWLEELKDAVYDAEDLLDEIAYEALRLKLEDKPQSTATQVRNYLSSLNPFNKRIGSKLQEILDTLEYMATQIHVLGLKAVVGHKPLARIPSTSLVDEGAVYGRHKDKEAIVKLLLSNDGSGNEIGVIPIVGMGGLGKTTLARLIYNDSQVKESFSLKAWVCVSEEFDVFRITKTILQEVVPGTYDDSNLNQLQLKLEEILTDKKFLFVVDDVWNKNYMDWEILQAPFRSGAKGSRIIVTTRDQRVASIMKTVPTYLLEQLGDDDSWRLFAKHAFKGTNPSEFPELEAFREEILKRCKGLPLAAKALGGILRSKVDAAEWDNILNSKMWDEESNILPVLRLSYYHLPSQLKRCFAYCSIFPKDYEIKKESLILLWMAEGFLDDPRRNNKEEVGEEYFSHLFERSFFQRSSGQNSCFVMHDLINDLAEAVSGKFCCTLEGEDSSKINKKTRHLSNIASYFDASEKFKGMDEALHLRTFLTLRPPWHLSDINDMVTEDLLPKLRHLRVLSLSGYHNIKKLSDSIGGLKQLRYLNLSETSVERLPESVSALYNLQTLILCGCWKLVALPTKLGRLVNLLVLDIRETGVKQMPLHMGRLKNLQVLTDFPVGKQNDSTINELKELHHLRGTLSIRSLQNVGSSKDASEAILCEKKRLQKLELSWDDDGHDGCSQQGRDVLHRLRPHPNLEDLVIKGYRDTIFPNWVGDCSFLGIVCLRLSNCKNCLWLPCLGQLPSLKELQISCFAAVVRVGAEFSGPFRSLLKLEFMKMPMWEEWFCAEGEDDAFARLQVLRLTECPKLKKALPNHLPSLRELHIENCGELEGALLRAPALRDHLEDLSAPHRPCLVLMSLQFLKILSCSKLDSLFPKGGILAPNLTLIYLDRCSNLKSLPQHMHSFLPSLENLLIIGCQEIESFPQGGLPSSLKYLAIYYSPKLITNYRQWGLRNLTSLTILEVEGSGANLESFPEENMLPSSLTTLRISDFENMKCLDGKGIRQLTSIRVLDIDNCSQLGCLPPDGLPSSLSFLSISRCPLLRQQCQKEKGHYWPKICHIPTIGLGGTLIRNSERSESNSQADYCGS